MQASCCCTMIANLLTLCRMVSLQGCRGAQITVIMSIFKFLFGESCGVCFFFNFILQVLNLLPSTFKVRANQPDFSLKDQLRGTSLSLRVEVTFFQGHFLKIFPIKYFTTDECLVIALSIH